MTRGTVPAHPSSVSLFSGVPAIGYALHAADRPTYSKALVTLDRHIADATTWRLRAAHERIERADHPELDEYDLISGLTGLGVYWLHRADHAQLRPVLHYLVRLTQPHRDGLPGWWSSSDTDGRRSLIGGHGNFGIAHGVTGPLALLAHTASANVTVPGHHVAMARVLDWLDHHQRGTGQRAWWPETISPSEQTSSSKQQRPGRPSWCYGTPGIARAQQLAAIALGDRQRQHLAEAALAGALTSEAQLAQITDASLCHGWAGLIQVTRRAARDAGTIDLAAQLPALHTRLRQHLARHPAPAGSGFLEGTAGIGLVSNRALADARWDACLLLS